MCDARFKTDGLIPVLLSLCYVPAALQGSRTRSELLLGLSARGSKGGVRQFVPFLLGGPSEINPGSAGWTLSATPAVFWGQTGCGPRAKVNFCSFPSKISGSKSVGLFLLGWVALQPWFLMKCSHSNQDAWEVYLYVLTVNIKAYCKISSAFVSVVNLTQTGLNTAWTLFFWTTFYQTLEKSTMTSRVNYPSKSQIPVILELSKYTTDDNFKKKNV